MRSKHNFIMQTLALQHVFNKALSGGVGNLNFGGLSTNLGTTMYQYQFRIPPYYTLLVRSLTILEGASQSCLPAQHMKYLFKRCGFASCGGACCVCMAQPPYSCRILVWRLRSQIHP